MAGTRLDSHVQHIYITSSVEQRILVGLWSKSPLAT